MAAQYYAQPPAPPPQQQQQPAAYNQQYAAYPSQQEQSGQQQYGSVSGYAPPPRSTPHAMQGFSTMYQQHQYAQPQHQDPIGAARGE